MRISDWSSDVCSSDLVAELSDQDMLDLAAYYSGLAPPPADPAAEPAPVDTTLARRGEQLYVMGDPAKGIPPFQGCPGRSAERRYGKARASPCRSRWSPYPIKKQTHNTKQTNTS